MKGIVRFILYYSGVSYTISQVKRLDRYIWTSIGRKIKTLEGYKITSKENELRSLKVRMDRLMANMEEIRAEKRQLELEIELLLMEKEFNKWPQ